MAFVDYTYYRDVFKGSRVSESDFPFLSERASEYVSYITAGRATDESEAVKKACCALVDEMNEMDTSGNIASETVGGHSISYADVGAMAKNKRLMSVAKMYLAFTGLLYCGVALKC